MVRRILPYAHFLIVAILLFAMAEFVFAGDTKYDDLVGTYYRSSSIPITGPYKVVVKEIVSENNAQYVTLDFYNDKNELVLEKTFTPGETKDVCSGTRKYRFTATRIDSGVIPPMNTATMLVRSADGCY